MARAPRSLRRWQQQNAERRATENTSRREALTSRLRGTPSQTEPQPQAEPQPVAEPSPTEQLASLRQRPAQEPVQEPAQAVEAQAPAAEPDRRAALAERQGRTTQQPQPQQRQAPQRSIFTRGVEAGVEQVRGSIPALGSTIAGSLGFEDTAEQLGEQATERQQRAGELLRDMPRAQDISSLEEAGQWAAGLVGSQAPVMAFQIGATLAGGSIGRRVSQRLGRPMAASPQALAGASRVARRGRQQEALEVDRPRFARGTVPGAATGGVTSGTALMAGEIQPRLLEDEQAREDFSTQELSQRALGGSAVAGAVGMAPIAGVLGRLGIGQTAESMVQRSIGRRLAQGTATQAALEGTTEGAQQAIARGTQAMVNDNVDVFDDEGLAEMLEATAAGTFIGAVSGGASALPGTALAQRTDAADPFEQEVERTRERMDSEAAREAAARRQHQRLREADPALSDELDSLVDEHGYHDPQVQRRFAQAELDLAQELDPRDRVPFEDIRPAVDRVDQEIGAQLELMRQDDSPTAEAEESQRRLLELSGELEEVRANQDTERFFNALADTWQDGGGPMVLTPELTRDLSATLEPYQAELMDVFRLRQSEQGESPHWLDAMSEAIELDTLQQEIDIGEHTFDLASEDDLSVHSELAEGFQLTQQEERPTYIGQRSGGQDGVPYQSFGTTRLLHRGSDRQLDDSVGRRLQTLQERDPDASFQRVSYRQAAEQEVADRIYNQQPTQDEPLSTDTFDQQLQTGLEQRARELHAQAEANGRPVAELFDPNDPTTFLDHFEMIQRTQLPPQLGQGDTPRFTASQFEQLTRQEHQDPQQPQTRGTINARVYKTSDASDRGAERRINIMDLATIGREQQNSMLDNVPGGEQGLTTERVAEAVFNGLSALLNQPGRTVEILPGPRGQRRQEDQGPRTAAERQAQFSNQNVFDAIPDDTVVFTQSAREATQTQPAREAREWTWGEVKRHGSQVMEGQINRLQAARDQATDTQEQQRLDGEIRALRNSMRNVRRSANRERQRELEEARFVTGNPYYMPSREEQAEAERVIALHERQEEQRLARDQLKEDFDTMRQQVANDQADEATSSFMAMLPDRAEQNFDAMMAGLAEGGQVDPRPSVEVDENVFAVRETDSEQLAQFKRRAQAYAQEREQLATGAGQPVQEMGDPPTRFEGTQVQTEFGVEARRAPGDQDFTRIGALTTRLGQVHRAQRRLANARSANTLRTIWREAGLGQPDRPPQTKAAMQRSLTNERNTLMQQLYTAGVEEKRNALRQVAGIGTLNQLRNKYEVLFGEQPPRNWGVDDFLDQQTLSEAQQRTPVTLDDIAREQQIVDGWVDGLGLDVRVRVVPLDELGQIVDDTVISRLASGRINAFATPVNDNNEVFVHVREGIQDRAARTGFMAHEVGHVVYHQAIENSTDLQAQKIFRQFLNWRARKNRPGVKLQTAVESKRSMAMMLQTSKNLRDGTRIRDVPPWMQEYLFDFNEWVADQTGRWLTSDKRPVGVVEQFFKPLADRLRSLMDAINPTSERRVVNREVRTLLGRMWNRRQADHAVDQRTQAAIDETMQEVPGQEAPPAPPREPPTDPPPANDPGPGTMLAAYTGYTGRFNETAVAAYRRMFRDELGQEERQVLARAFTGERVQRQLRQIFQDDPAATSRDLLGAMDRGAADLVFAYGMDAWMRGELELTPRPNTMLQQIYDRIREAFGILSDAERAEAFLTPLRNAEQVVLEQAGPMPARFQERDALQQYARRATEFIEGSVVPVFRGFYGAQSRLYMTQNPALIALTNQFQPRTGRGGVRGSFFEARQLAEARFTNRVRTIMDGLSQEDGQQIVEVLQDPNATFPADMDVSHVEDLRQRAGQIQALLREMRDYAVERGVAIGDQGPDYFPWVFDPQALMDNRQAFINLISQEKYSAYLGAETDEGRRLAAEKIYNSLLDNEGYGDVFHEPQEGGHLPYFASANQRTLAWVQDAGSEADRSQLATFFNKDLGYILTSYTNQMVKRAEYTARFGTWANENRAQLGNHARLERMLTRAREQGATDNDIKVARDFVSAMMGSYGKELAPPLKFAVETTGKMLGRDWSNVDPRRIRKLQGAMMVYQNVRVLGLATMTSIADVGGIITRSNDPAIAMQAFRAGLREIADGIRRRTRNDAEYKSELRKLGETLGTIEASTINNALGELYGGSYLTGRMRRWNDAFFNAIQLQRWTRLSRLMGLEAGRHFLLQHRTGTYSDHSRRFLDELGLTPDDIRTTADGNDLLLLSDEERRTLAEQGEREELLRDDRIRVALNRFTDQSVMRPNAAQRPIWGSHPDAMLAFHLKQFTYTIHDRIVRRSFQEIGQGNYYPIFAMLSYVPIMIASDLLRELIQYGPEGDPRKQHWGMVDYAREGAHRAGIAGLGTFLLDAHKDRTQFGGVGYESFRGPALTQLSQLGSAIAGNDQQQQNAVINALPGNALYRNWDLEAPMDEATWGEQANAISGWHQ